MGKRIVAVIVIVAACFAGYVYYQHQKEQTQLANGDVQCIGCDSPEQHARFLRENSGETADGNSEHKNQSARQAAAQAVAADATADAPGYNSAARDTPGILAPAQTSSMQPAARQTGPTRAAALPDGYPQPASVGSPLSMTPSGDSQAANNPNGAHFGGSGAYQWYRQGDVTYRIDTTSGRSCIAYATMQEWRKQIVMSHGCGRES